MLRRIQKGFLYFLHAVLLFATIYSTYKGEYLNAIMTLGILILTFLPFIFKRKFKLYLPLEIDSFIIIIIFAGLFLGDFHGYYYKFWWWDIMLHLSSGFLLGIGGFMLVYVLNQEKNIKIKMAPSFVAFFSVAFAVTMGVIWEIAEFTLDASFGLNMQKTGIADTMGDLIIDFFGALIIGIIGFLYIKYRRNSYIFEKLIKLSKVNTFFLSVLCNVVYIQSNETC